MVVFSLSYAIVGRTSHNHQSFSQAFANGFDSTYVSLLYNNATQQLDTMIISYVRYKKAPSKIETEQLYNWLKVRTKADSLLVITK